MGCWTSPETLARRLMWRSWTIFGGPSLACSFYTVVNGLRLFQQAQTDASTMSLADRFESESVVIISDANVCTNQMGEGFLCFPGTGVGAKIIAEPKVGFEPRRTGGGVTRYPHTTVSSTRYPRSCSPTSAARTAEGPNCFVELGQAPTSIQS